MDKKLELRLIECGYNPTQSSEVNLEEAGKIIKKNIYNGSIDSLPGMLLFDGRVNAVIRTGLGHTIMDKDSLAITSGDSGRGGLFIYAPQDDANGQRSSVYIEKDGSYFVAVPKRDSYQSDNRLDLWVKAENDMRDKAKVELFKADDTKVLYLPQTDGVESNRLFWNHIADQFDLELTEIEPQYTDKSPVTPWYNAIDEQSEIKLTLGTRYRVHAVRADFPNEKSTQELTNYIDGLRVNPQTVNDIWDPTFSSKGKTCETHINKGQGDQVVAYLTNILKTK